MQTLEKVQGHKWKSISKSDSDTVFVRSGQGNQWAKLLSIHAQEIIYDSWGYLMERLGYEK